MAHAIAKIQTDVIPILGATCAVVMIVVQQTPDAAHRTRIGKTTPVGLLTAAAQLQLPAGTTRPTVVV